MWTQQEQTQLKVWGLNYTGKHYGGFRSGLVWHTSWVTRGKFKAFKNQHVNHSPQRADVLDTKGTIC